MIRAEKLTVEYPGAVTALREVSFTVGRGERVALLGQNGAGKSTLLLSLAGVLFPSSGNLSVGGVPVTRARLDDIRRLVGFVFQNPDDQLFMPTVEDDLCFGPRNFGVDTETMMKRVRDTAEALRIAHLLKRPVYHLSGGEKRLAALAGVLVMEGEILLLDEPCAFLDTRSRRALVSILNALAHTMLIATHDFDLARSLCSRVIILRDGSVCAEGKTAEILDDPELLEQCGL
ncbi:MAG: energy-coupling factor ABC transporter ATP-binding protein [Treponema sp.]|nr:energy-coupling factor ABC transporter ATP-binding protein [Treponema sp.]